MDANVANEIKVFPRAFASLFPVYTLHACSCKHVKRELMKVDRFTENSVNKKPTDRIYFYVK